MKKNIIILFIQITLLQSVFSQEYTLMGKFINQEQEPIEFAKVSLYQNDTVLVNGTVTDSLGIFSLSIQEGVYTVKLEKTKVEYWTNRLELNKNIDLGTVEVDEAKILNEITVTNERPLWVRKPDRLIFNVENSIAASSGTLLDALRVTPGVQVVATSISIIGRSNVLILIDDRNVHLSGESLMNYLSSISAESIQSIEVMTTPPAKYDAQGAGGIINIRYKKGRRNSWKNTAQVNTYQGFYGSYSFMDNFSYNKNKLSFDVNLNALKGEDIRLAYMDTYYSTQTWIEQMQTKVARESYSGRLNIAYQVSEKSSLGAIIDYGQYAPPKNKTTGNGSVIENNSIVNRIYTIGEELNKDDWLSANVNYDLQFGEKGGNITVNFDYFDFSNKNRGFFNSKHTHINGTDILHMIGENQSDLGIENYSGKIDVQHLGGIISYGAKTSSTQTNSKVGFLNMATGSPIEDTTKTNRFTYQENVHAIYANAMYGSQKIQMQLGMRYEYTETKSHSAQKDSTNKRGYGHFFPTAFLMYMINDVDFLNVNYSRRIGRPKFWEMDPFRMQLNAYSYVEGNPFLQPEFDNTVELTYGFKQQLYLQASVSNTSQGYAQITRVDSITKVQALVRDNFYSFTKYTIGAYYGFYDLNWLETQVQAQAYWGTTKLKNDSYKDIFSLYAGNGGVLQMYNLIKNIDKKNKLNFEVAYSYNFPTKILMFEMKETHSVDLGMRLYLFDRDLSFRLYVQDIFKTAIPNNYSTSDGVRQRIAFYEQPPRFVTLSVRYRFGNKTVKSIDKEFGNQDEQNRSKKNN